jgi:pyruvate,water dikinase
MSPRLPILLVLLLPLLARGLDEDGFVVSGAEADPSGRMVIRCPGEKGYVYTLLRGASPEAVTFPVAIGNRMPLRDSVQIRQRAFYSVARIPSSDFQDTDGDGTGDWMELQDPRANPLNPARSIAPEDGAILLPGREAFDAVSHRDNFPGAPDVREVKFLIMGADTAKPALYFLNASRHQYHYYFAQEVLGYPGSLNTFNNETYFTNTTRKQIAGSLVVHESWQPPGGGPPGVVTMEFWPSDPVSYPFVQKAYDLISRSMTWLDRRFAYHAASETQRTLYRAERAQFDSALRDRLDIITTEELFGQTSYTMLNPGVGYGRLIVYDGSAPMSARDVVIFRTLPNEISRTAGIITEAPQTPLSHINLKAKQNNTPNAYIRNASTHASLAPLMGRYVRYETLADGFTVREATQEEVDTHLESLRPVNPQIPVRDLTKRSILPLGSLGFASAGGYGAKTANVAELRKFLPSTMVPDGHGIPFYYYDEFMKYNGFYTVAAELMADPFFRTDAAYRRFQLDWLRRLIRQGQLPSWMITDLATLQGRFPAGTGIRCRSSTNNEDLEGFSGAGLYDSYTHRPDEGHLSNTVKQTWASLWNERAWDEREFYRVDHMIAAMGVLCHPNQDDEIANGVAVTKNIIDPNWTGYYVNAQLGESLVTNPDPNAVPEEFLIARLLGQDRYTIQHVTYSNLVPEGQTVITTAQAEQLADRMAAIHSRFLPLYNGVYGVFAMEIEWKITSTGALQIKQARPWVE